MLCRLFRVSGYVFEEAEDGLLAIEKVKAKMSVSEKNHYDVILMDFVMPNMDGPTATKSIRDLGYTAPIFGKIKCIS
jgi:CheY-like chemotaxis protein